MEVLLVRFDKKQRNFIRSYAKRCKVSEAALVRAAINDMRIQVGAYKEVETPPEINK